MFRLVGTDGDRVYTFDLAPGSHLLGRKGKVDMAVPNATVSRRHAQIEVSADQDQVLRAVPRLQPGGRRGAKHAQHTRGQAPESARADQRAHIQ